jgi:hypothetical protein
MTDPIIRTAPEIDTATYRAVSGLRANLTKITSSQDGKVGLAIALEAHDPDTISAIKELIGVQQGEVFISIDGTQPQAQGDA